MMLFVLSNIINDMGFLIFIAYLLSRHRLFKQLATKQRSSAVEKVAMALIFGGMGIVATYSGTPVGGAVANSRIVGVLVGGLIGGPWVGFGAGLVAGIHRWLYDIDGFTSVACMVSTVIAGLVGGFCAKYYLRGRLNWLSIYFVGMLTEALQMLIVLLVAKPYTHALDVVSVLWVPMVFFNPIGISVFVAMIQSLHKERERDVAEQTQLALDIADRCLEPLKMGLKDIAAVEEMARTIYQMSRFAAVAITDTQGVIAHVGTCSDHHHHGDPLTTIAQKALDENQVVVAKERSQLGCTHDKCTLSAAVAVKLEGDDTHMGTLIFYKAKRHTISERDERLATGLARLFSTQLKLAAIDRQIQLREKAELKALQAQINPHFLFNALNTVGYFCRVNPDQARQLVSNLSTHLRSTLEFNEQIVSLDTELKHVHAFVAIEQARFDHPFQLEVQVPETALTRCRLPQLILQPLVENAIKHGLRDHYHCADRTGIIQIQVTEHPSTTALTILDNGAGIDPNLVTALMTGTMAEHKIGLLNVYTRLKVLYGPESFKILPLPTGGTRIELIIPLEQ